MRIALALPRHPLLRALLLAAGALILVGLLFFGLIAGVAVIAFGALVLLVRRLLPRKTTRATHGDVAGDAVLKGAAIKGEVIEGEFRVVEPPPRARNG